MTQDSKLDGIRHDWGQEEVERLFRSPFNDLLFRAQSIHRRYFDPNAVQLSTLVSIKTGGCPEDCAYCPQSVRFDTGLRRQPLMNAEKVLEAAGRAKANGATRFCMGAAWRRPKDRELACVARMIRGVKALGLETCATLGMLEPEQAAVLKASGLDYYNHNLDTSESFYGAVISSRTYQDRLETLANVREAGIRVCCGGILGLGETEADRAALLRALANMPAHPESVPINQLIRVPGTPLAAATPPDPFDIVRSIAVARILMPRSYVRLSAGRLEMHDTLQALCFLAGANSIFLGDRLLTAENPALADDRDLFDRLGLRRESPPAAGAWRRTSDEAGPASAY